MREVDEFKDALLRSISHNLRTPMNGVQSSIEMAQCSDDPAQLEILLDEAKSHSMIMMNMINDLIDFSLHNQRKLKIKQEHDRNKQEHDRIKRRSELYNIVRKLQISKD